MSTRSANAFLGLAKTCGKLKTHSGTIWATDLPSQVPKPFPSCQKSSSPEPNRPERHHFYPSYAFAWSPATNFQDFLLEPEVLLRKSRLAISNFRFGIRQTGSKTGKDQSSYCQLRSMRPPRL